MHRPSPSATLPPARRSTTPPTEQHPRPASAVYADPSRLTSTRPFGNRGRHRSVPVPGGHDIPVRSPLGAGGSSRRQSVPGVYNAAQKVTFSDATPGATIYYTNNGTTPTTSSFVYSGPITVGASETVNAIAVTSASTSPTGSAAYTITTATPTSRRRHLQRSPDRHPDDGFVPRASSTPPTVQRPRQTARSLRYTRDPSLFSIEALRINTRGRTGFTYSPIVSVTTTVAPQSPRLRSSRLPAAPMPAPRPSPSATSPPAQPSTTPPTGLRRPRRRPYIPTHQRRKLPRKPSTPLLT